MNWRAFLLTAFAPGFAGAAELIHKEGLVEVTKAGSAAAQPAAIPAALVARDQVGTGEASRAILRMRQAWNARVDEQTLVEITPTGLVALDPPLLRLERGQTFIYSREPKGEWRVMTPAGQGTGRGTQVLVRVAPDGTTFLQVIEGECDFANDQGGIALGAGEAGEASPGSAPRKTAVIETRNLLQWALYYPAVLVPDELGLTADERRRVSASLAAYRAGDLLSALETYPRHDVPASDAARVYRAGIVLATGRVDDARRLLQAVPPTHPGRRALERMLAAVLATEIPDGPAVSPATASEALAESYLRQSRRELERARTAAARAAELAPESGFAWARLAEMEFSFGRTAAAWSALERALRLSPRHAPAHALRGFLLTARSRFDEARSAFERAVQLDGALGYGWLGLGLSKVRQGRSAAGTMDLHTAVTVEPTRAFFYSYHAKALADAAAGDRAEKDYALAKQLDPNDPTPWLYSAIQRQQEGRYNAAIEDLQRSLALNDNRRVYRSEFLLDQDRAVRSSNLARIYQHNGMTELAVREATRAVEDDYTNPSAHLFLANSFDALRDPRRIALRYETAWFNEQLLADLFAPVGGGPLSHYVSQQEYSKLFAADGLGAGAVTEWRDDGYVHQLASVFGTWRRFSAGVDFSYRRDNETRPNHDNALREVNAQAKYQVTEDDVAYLLTQWRTQKNGDLLQNYRHAPGNPGLRFREDQEPGLLLAGWNHRWAPGVHTVVLAGRLAAVQRVIEPGIVRPLLVRDAGYFQPGFLVPGPNGILVLADPALRNAIVPPVAVNNDGSLALSAEFLRAIEPFLGRAPVTQIDVLTDHRTDSAMRREFEIYSGEIQQVWQRRRNTLIVGGRWQAGTFDTRSRLELLNPNLTPFAMGPVADQRVGTDFERRSLYVYDFLPLTRALTVLAGVTWDRLERPDNFRLPPVNGRQVTNERVDGKIGVTFAPSRWLTVRGLLAEATGGVSFDDTVRLEPVQLAGFNQAFRTIISESLEGSVEAPRYRSAGLSAEGSLPTRTWWSVAASRLTERVDRTVGAFDVIVAPGLFPRGSAILPAGTSQQLDYREQALRVSVNQLIGRELALGADYRVTRAELRDRLPQIPVEQNPYADDYNRAVLEELALHGHWNSATGWFARADATWYSQDLHGTAGGQLKLSPSGDHFWHAGAYAGFRFHRNRREVRVGVLNLTDRDYRLSPLTYLPDLPRERTVFVRCRVTF